MFEISRYLEIQSVLECITESQLSEWGTLDILPYQDLGNMFAGSV